MRVRKNCSGGQERNEVALFLSITHSTCPSPVLPQGQCHTRKQLLSTETRGRAHSGLSILWTLWNQNHGIWKNSEYILRQTPPPPTCPAAPVTELILRLREVRATSRGYTTALLEKLVSLWFSQGGQKEAAPTAVWGIAMKQELETFPRCH